VKTGHESKLETANMRIRWICGMSLRVRVSFQ
jgi:hypothetical protein